MALCVTWGPSPGTAVCWAPWKLNPEPLLALLLPGVHPSRMLESRGLAKPQMFRALTQGLRVLCRELMWPQRWSWNWLRSLRDSGV